MNNPVSGESSARGYLSLVLRLTGQTWQSAAPDTFLPTTPTTMTDKPTTPLPTVHLGGTSHKMLTEGYEEAHYTLGLFTKSFGSIEFNGRDYYQQGPDAWMAAVDARIEINKKISDLFKYIEAHLESLAEQAPKK